MNIQIEQTTNSIIASFKVLDDPVRLVVPRAQREWFVKTMRQMVARQIEEANHDAISIVTVGMLGGNVSPGLQGWRLLPAFWPGPTLGANHCMLANTDALALASAIEAAS